MDSYCKDNKFHLIPVAADNTWQVQNNQVAEKEKREQILYKCATVYYVGLHMTNATIKAEYQYTNNLKKIRVALATKLERREWLSGYCFAVARVD